jgi:histidinol-phosphate aminotransferase
MDFTKLIRKHIQNLTPYSSARDEYSGKEGIFLDANENPHTSVLSENYNRYPDPYQFEIKQKLGAIKGLSPNQIFIGNGSDEPIDLLIKAICEPLNDNILLMPPTYGMYKVCADIQQVRITLAPLTEDFQIDLDNVFDAVNSATKIIWVCSPNNPSGNLLDKNAIFQIIKAFPEKLVVIDEAYIDFAAGNSFITELSNYKNLCILQTFSKAWGMAGLRLGVAYAHPEIILVLNKIKYPYNINILTQQKLLEALDKTEEKENLVKMILAEREKLKNELIQLPQVKRIFDSDSNMLLVKFENSNGVMDYLLKNKIIVRDRSKVILCEDCLRISVGTQFENEELIKVLKEINI